MKNVKVKDKIERTPLEKLSSALGAFLIVLMLIYCISLIIPLLWVLINSFKEYDDFMLHHFELPQKWTFENYSSIFSVFKVRLIAKNGARIKYGIETMLLFSIIWSTSLSFILVFTTTLVAYVLSKYRFFGRNFLYSLGIFVMITPIVGSMPSAMYVKKMLGIYNNMFFMLITAPTAAFSGLHFLILYGAFKRIPWSYAEAVFVDGGGHFNALFKVMLPMMLPTCAVLFVLDFLNSWNDYNTFLVWLPSYPSLSLGLFLFQNDAYIYGVGMPTVLAAFIIVIIPTVILYFSSQKLILSKFTVGGLKG